MTTPLQRARSTHLRSLEEVSQAAKALAAGGRHLLGIAGPPGSGKSTIAGALRETLGERMAVVAMDGFHLADDELERLGRRSRKGAPDTFDIGGFAALLRRLRSPSTGTVYAPVFDRGLEESIGSALPIPSQTPLVLVEGNYLLHSRGGWEEIAPLLDERWYLDVPPEVRRARLLERRLGCGHSREASESWIDEVDLPNGHLIERGRAIADRVIALDGDS